jgi:crotonobetainyl-CoA:carnitine CoA-transferase CaiB-like acyl-CoA transferase
VLAAIEARDRIGAGQHVEVAQREAAVTFLGQFIAAAAADEPAWRRRGNRDPHAVPQGVYPCREPDTWVAVSVGSDDAWRALSRLLGLSDDSSLLTLEGRRSDADAIDDRVATWTRLRDHREAMQELQAVGVAAGAVLSNKELLEDPHLAARHFFQVVDHPDTGPFPYVGFAFQLSHTPPCVRMPGPSLGAHNRDILGGLLGMSDAEIDELEAAGVIADRPRGM